MDNKHSLDSITPPVSSTATVLGVGPVESTTYFDTTWSSIPPTFSELNSGLDLCDSLHEEVVETALLQMILDPPNIDAFSEAIGALSLLRVT